MDGICASKLDTTHYLAWRSTISTARAQTLPHTERRFLTITAHVQNCHTHTYTYLHTRYAHVNLPAEAERFNLPECYEKLRKRRIQMMKEGWYGGARERGTVARERYPPQLACREQSNNNSRMAIPFICFSSPPRNDNK